MENIGWCSTNTSVRCALGVISVPVLLTAMSAAPLIRDQEIHYEAAVSKDRDFIVIEGATHGGFPCVPCETTPGQYSNTEKNNYDSLAKWINARYPRVPKTARLKRGRSTTALTSVSAARVELLEKRTRRSTV